VIESKFELFHIFYDDVIRGHGVGHFLEKCHGFFEGQRIQIVVRMKKQLCNNVFHNLRIHNEFEDITTRADETFNQKKIHCFKKLHFFFLASFFLFLPFNKVLITIMFFIVFLVERG